MSSSCDDHTVWIVSSCGA